MDTHPLIKSKVVQDIKGLKRAYNATNPPVLGSDANVGLTFAWFDSVIKMYEEVNFDEISDLQVQNMARRNKQTNKFGSNKKKNWRWSLSIPTRLYSALNKVKHNWWQDKDMVHKFMKRYPKYSIPEKV